MRWLVLLLPLTLVACPAGDEPRFRIKQKSCKTDYLDYAGGLTHHLLQGPGDGTFAYDPLGEVKTELDGSYDLQTGDFAWTESFHDDHFRTARTVEGYGYARMSGDLDLEATVQTTDVTGFTSTYTIREERVGCEVTRRTTNDVGEVSWHYGTFGDGRYTYTDEETYQGQPWVTEGTLYADLTWEESVAFEQGVESYTAHTVGDSYGYRVIEWTDAGADALYEGTTEHFLDGSRHVAYTIDGSSTVDYTVDYRGNGSGTYSGDGFSCDMSYTEFDCVMSCSDGNDYAC